VSASRFRFVQLDVPGRLGIDDGRYLLRGHDNDSPEAVVVVQTFGAPPPARRSRRQRRPRRATPDADLAEVPLTRLTVIPADELEPAGATPDLESLAGDPDAAEDAVARGLRVVNEVLRAHRVATRDPYGHELSRDAAVAVRVGYGTGEALAEGRWEAAVDVQPPERRRRRADALRPQERLAAVLAGREPIDVCETLLLRARADLEQGRPREAALQLRIGLEALLAELPENPGPEQGEDLAALEGRLEAVRRAADEALLGGLTEKRAAEVAKTLTTCERVLRRRQILGRESAE
jgi:hypothetical protein